jgi:hypothetical protein
LTAGSFGTTDVKILYRELVNITCTVIFLHRHASDAGWQPALSACNQGGANMRTLQRMPANQQFTVMQQRRFLNN